MSMADKLASGFKVKTLLGRVVTVNKHLGEGGQGDVYAVDYNGKPMVLKWYKPNGMGKNPKAFYDNIKNNVMRGSPSEEFLWPLDITEWKDGTFGYIMGLRPEGYYEITDFMLCHVRFPSYKAIIDASLHIVSAFRKLHNAGYAYPNLDESYFFIEPASGNVLICDNDDVAPCKTAADILGKPRYMAPEIVMGKNMPDKLSDCFSMSVILFILLCRSHPFEGKRALLTCMTPKLTEEIYGINALFVMDQDNRENAPDPIIHRVSVSIWNSLPDYMKEFLQGVFSQTSIRSPDSRPTEIDWMRVLIRLRGDIVTCQCGNELFWKESNCLCEKCGKRIDDSYRKLARE